jgi:hypothetical protein
LCGTGAQAVKECDVLDIGVYVEGKLIVCSKKVNEVGTPTFTKDGKSSASAYYVDGAYRGFLGSYNNNDIKFSNKEITYPSYFDTRKMCQNQVDFDESGFSSYINLERNSIHEATWTAYANTSSYNNSYNEGPLELTVECSSITYDGAGLGLCFYIISGSSWYNKSITNSYIDYGSSGEYRSTFDFGFGTTTINASGRDFVSGHGYTEVSPQRVDNWIYRTYWPCGHANEGTCPTSHPNPVGIFESGNVQQFTRTVHGAWPYDEDIGSSHKASGISIINDELGWIWKYTSEYTSNESCNPFDYRSSTGTTTGNTYIQGVEVDSDIFGSGEVFSNVTVDLCAVIRTYAGDDEGNYTHVGGWYNKEFTNLVDMLKRNNLLDEYNDWIYNATALRPYASKAVILPLPQ